LGLQSFAHCGYAVVTYPIFTISEKYSELVTLENQSCDCQNTDSVSCNIQLSGQHTLLVMIECRNWKHLYGSFCIFRTCS